MVWDGMDERDVRWVFVRLWDGVAWDIAGIGYISHHFISRSQFLSIHTLFKWLIGWTRLLFCCFLALFWCAGICMNNMACGVAFLPLLLFFLLRVCLGGGDVRDEMKEDRIAWESIEQWHAELSVIGA
ncbi:hypothetical protein BDV95DRAFT_582702 [Massariosphaeria phaeospora]|uniref:Uncharacterized protein n=1 Tax=Massariosphaeria phaeospora TaxID=100035 RepID=A0A7C8I1Z0_9PLEO|nr:hypothetical protein BDV95DRAFT_582702 [Massariosphaeria phaeospora]